MHIMIHRYIYMQYTNEYQIVAQCQGSKKLGPKARHGDRAQHRGTWKPCPVSAAWDIQPFFIGKKNKISLGSYFKTKKTNIEKTTRSSGQKN